MALQGRRSAAVLFSSFVYPSFRSLGDGYKVLSQVFFGPRSLLPYAKVFFGPFAGDEHHQ